MPHAPDVPDPPDVPRPVPDRAPGWRDRIVRATERVQGWLLPPCCVLCLDAGQAPTLDLCVECEADLSRNLRACPLCAEGLGANASFAADPRVGAALDPCPRCRDRPPEFDAAFVPYRYEWPVDGLVRTLKYRGRLAHARVLGTLFAAHVAAEYRACGRALPQLIVPVPLHPERERTRGYNQAWELARVIGARLQVPVAPRACERRRDTPAQAGLAAAARAVNLRDAFVAQRLPRRVQRVALLDDVMTTGATLGELARVLRAQGVGVVEAWAIARA